MTDECITPLRQRMIEDMSLRHFGEKTQKDYIRAVKKLTIFLGRTQPPMRTCVCSSCTWLRTAWVRRP